MPSALPRSIGRWAILLAGMALVALIASAMAQRAQDQAADFAKNRAMDQAKGFRVWLYDNPFLTGEIKHYLKPSPVFHQNHTPTPQRPHPFSWRWLAAVEAPDTGDYVFEIFAAEAVRLRVDGRRVIERWEAVAPRMLRVMVHLDAGTHLVDLQNVQRRHRLALTLSWIPPKANYEEIIPAPALRPLDEKVSAGDLYRLGRAVDQWRALVWILPGVWLVLWIFFLRRPETSLRGLARHHWFLLILALAGLTRLLWADVVPGISGESAFFSWRAQLILEGAWPFEGMTTRTGPLFDYILAVPVAVFGAGPWLHRIVGGLLNLLALVFCYRVVCREIDRRTGILAALILAVTPVVVAFARMPGDNTGLGPLMFFLGLDLLSLSRSRPSMAVWGGIIWGLATFNHSIFAILPFTLGLSALAVSRLRILADMRTYGFGLGFLIGFGPRIWDRLANGPGDAMSFTDPARMLDLPAYLAMFARVLDGEVLYQYFTGYHLWNTWWAAPLVYLAGFAFLAWAAWRRRDSKWWVEAWLGLGLLLHLILVPLGAPSGNPRYYLYAALFAGLLLARAWGRALDLGGIKARAWLGVGFAAFLALNLASLGVNYFHAHLSTGGRTLSWEDPLLDHTPDAWMDHSLLTAELVRRGYPVVATADFWHHTLDLALNLYQGEPKTFMAVPFVSHSGTQRAAVFYNSPEGKYKMRQFLEGNPKKSFKRVSLGPELDSKYILFERVDPVTYPPVLEDRP